MKDTCLLVIDIQRGAFDGARCPPIDRAQPLVDHAATLIAAARQGGTPVVFVRHCEGPGTPFEDGTPHGELHEALPPLPGETVVCKRESSAFDGTELAPVLEALGARSVVVCGLQSEFCVANTSKAALQRGYAVHLASDGHSTWPWEGRTADEISAGVNDELSKLGAKLAATEQLAAAMRMRD